MDQERIERLSSLLNLPLDQLPPEVKSVFYGFLIDGIQGGMDAAALVGIDKLPEPLRDIANDLLGGVNWIEVPAKISEAVGSFFSSAGEGLSSFLSNISGGIDLSNLNVGNVINDITNGGFGQIPQFLSDLGSIPLLSSFFPGTGIINAASTVMGVFDGGLGQVFDNLFSGAGFGLSNVLNALGVSETITGLIGPIFTLFGLGGDANEECPCAPGCRKIDHFITEDEDILLEKCSSVILNSSSSYLPRGGPDVTDNNNNPISDIFNLVQTNLGQKLIPQNILNLTEFITSVLRIGDMAQRVEGARNADFPDWQNELIYTFKAIENGFKINDNNVTKIEEILGLFLKGNLFMQLFNRKRDDYTFEVLNDHSRAIEAMQAQITKLDAVKVGSSAGAYPTEPVQKTKKHIGKINPYKASNNLDWKELLEILESALKIWNSLKPGNNPDFSEITKNIQENNQEEGEETSYSFPEVNIAFEVGGLLDKYSEPEYYQEQYKVYSGIDQNNYTDEEPVILPAEEGQKVGIFEVPPLFKPEITAEIRNNFPEIAEFEASYPEWDIQEFNRFVNNRLVEEYPSLLDQFPDYNSIKMKYPKWEEIIVNRFTSEGGLLEALITQDYPDWEKPIFERFKNLMEFVPTEVSERTSIPIATAPILPQDGDIEGRMVSPQSVDTIRFDPLSFDRTNIEAISPPDTPEMVIPDNEISPSDVLSSNLEIPRFTSRFDRGTISPPEFIEALRNIYKQYEQETAKGKETYC